MKNFFGKFRRSITLVELLVAISLFSAASMMAVEVFINITRIQGRIALENAIYEDARFMMERISREVRNNAVDYEEYFSRAIGEEGTDQLGKYYGCYAAQFYDPGRGKIGDTNLSSPTTPGELGAICTNNPATAYPTGTCNLFRPSLDKNTGEFPYKNNTKVISGDEKSNAFCPVIYSKTSHPDFWTPSSVCTGDETFYSMNKLFLISRDGTAKTIFARKIVNDSPNEFALAMLKLKGEDNDNDGKTETWENCESSANAYCCEAGFDCDFDTFTWEGLNKYLTTLQTDLYLGFVPLSPLRTNLKDLRFDITPVEDPRKAYAEADKIVQPKVTITLTVKPNAAQLGQYTSLQAIPELTLQTTVSPRVMSNIDSYLGEISNTKCAGFL